MRLSVFCLVLTALLFSTSCNDDNAGNTTNPTSLSGRVIVQDTGEPLAGGAINISGSDNRFPVNRILVGETKDLDDEGKFEFEFEGDDRIDEFTITIFDVPNQTGPLFTGFDCGIIDCNSVPPGLDYEDLVLEVIR